MNPSRRHATAVLLHPDDNVLCLLRDHARDETPVLQMPGNRLPAPALRQATPLGHKVALADIGKGEAIIKYGVTVALARQDIAAGEHAHIHNLSDPHRQAVENRLRPSQTNTTDVSAALVLPGGKAARQRQLPTTFAGYRRSSGRPGIRNHLLVMSVCGLNAAGARKVKAALPGSQLLGTPFGRGQLGPDREFHDRMLVQLACHPNVGGVILLAADREMRQRYQSLIHASGRPCVGFSLQECGEDTVLLTQGAIAAGIELQSQLTGTERQPCAMDSLAIAIECGHSDASSGMVSNPLCGLFADELINGGGAALFSETIEWSGTERELYQRCQSSEIAERLHALVTARHALAQQAGTDLLRGNPGPQNHAGGISTLAEKSRGAIAKGGSSSIAGALMQGEALPTGTGLYLMDTPALSPESITSMVASGAQLVLFTTGHGNPYGSAIAPTIKISANPQTAQRVSHQLDFDASPVFNGLQGLPELLPALSELVLRVCEGESVAAERLDEGDEVISRLSASV